MNKRECGAVWEEKARAYLCSLGYEILAHNFYTHFGEIDIVAKDGDMLVFVEVKYRADTGRGYPQEAVNARKQQRIRKSAEYYLFRHGYADCPCRFDVIAILGNELTHIKDAF